MHYFSNKFSKIAKRRGLSAPQRPLIFNFGELKLRNFAKLCLFKLIITKSNFKKSIMMAFYYVTTLTSQKISIPLPPPIKISGYASV